MDKKVGSRSISSCGVVFKVIIFVAALAGCSALVENNNAKFCVIHVGPHKTGSTSLQEFFLVHHNDDLKKDNYESPQFLNGRGKDHAALAFCIRTELTGMLCSAKIQRDRIEYFESFVDDAAAHGSNILLSSEELDRPNLNITQLTSVLVPHQYKIHVVVYYRRFYDWIHSIHNQVTKGMGSQHLTFVQWLTDEALENYREIYSVSVYNRYKETAGIFNVSVVNMHEDPDNFNTNARFACDHMDNAPHLCRIAKSIPAEHINPSKSLDWQLFRKNIDIYHSIDLSNLKKNTWEKIKVKFYEMTDIPRLCLSPQWKDKLLQKSLESEKTLTPESWYNSKEGLENLKSDFEGKINSKLCSMDIERILLSSDWQDFLTDLEEDAVEQGY